MKKVREKRTFRMVSILLAVLFLAGCGAAPAAQTASESGAGFSQPYTLKAAVLYCEAASDGGWQDTLSRLEQSLELNLSAEAVEVTDGAELSGYDILYLDSSVTGAADEAGLAGDIMSFAENGGSVFVTNGCHGMFYPEFIGAKAFVQLESLPEHLSFPKLGDDLGGLQGIISDFASLYASFEGYDKLCTYDYGYGVVPSTATALVKSGSTALYTMNRWGRGYVFFTNPLLPNTFAVNGFSVEPRNSAQTALSCTTASCNQLLENGFAAYVSKQKFGFSLSRVFGCFGRPSMAWELHFEEITGFENGSGIDFGELCREYSQVPSYSLIRNTYWWFLRAESVSYLLGSDKGYAMDMYESAYSSGTHVASGNQWLSIGRVENAGSYFYDYPEYRQRSYPCFADMDGDGDTDILCGASDGYFYYFDGLGYSDRLHTAEAVRITDPSGRELNVFSYSAPVMFDVNGDGLEDIVSGCSDGKIYWFSGCGDMKFEYEGLLCGCVTGGQSLPDIGDLNGDGCADLIVGSDCSELAVWFGSSGDKLEISEKTALAVPEELGYWLAPRVIPEGKAQLALGTADGYIAKLSYTASGLVPDGYIDLEEMNFKGNSHAKIGNNCVPCFADLNRDGVLDLACGGLEYGLAYPIDSEYFPYHDQLQKSIDYIKDNDFYLGAHFYTNSYASPQREAYELAAQRQAMKNAYGVDTDGTGINQHTWYMSTHDQKQSLRSAWNAGLLWNSGFSPAGSVTAPQISAGNVVSLPFFMLDGGERTILLQNCATLLYSDKSWTDISARRGMPMCMYYHCDFTHGNEETAREFLQMAEDFRREHSYNFVCEDQLMLASAAAYNLTAEAQSAGESGFGLKLDFGSAESDFPLYDERYQGSCGVKLSLGEAYSGISLKTDADVWYRDGNDIYLSANRPVSISEGEGGGAHLQQVNIAARVSASTQGAEIEFLDDGMLQAVVCGNASTAQPGWDVKSENGLTIFTKYGKAEALSIVFD